MVGQIGKSTAKADLNGFGCRVAELFSPPRVVAEAERLHRGSGKSYDLLTGYDLGKRAVQEQVSKELARDRPQLLGASPPCTWCGGFSYINRQKMPLVEYLRKVRQAKVYIRFCCQELERQLDRGGEAFFEHPWSSWVWKMPETRRLMRRMQLQPLRHQTDEEGLGGAGQQRGNGQKGCEEVPGT